MNFYKFEKHNWHYIPDNCLEIILNNLNDHQVGSLRLVCRSWNAQILHIFKTLKPVTGTPIASIQKTFPALKSLVLNFSECRIPSLASLALFSDLTDLSLTGDALFSDLQLAQLYEIAQIGLSTLYLSNLRIEAQEKDLYTLAKHSLLLDRVTFNDPTPPHANEQSPQDDTSSDTTTIHINDYSLTNQSKDCQGILSSVPKTTKSALTIRNLQLLSVHCFDLHNLSLFTKLTSLTLYHDAITDLPYFPIISSLSYLTHLHIGFFGAKSEHICHSFSAFCKSAASRLCTLQLHLIGERSSLPGYVEALTALTNLTSLQLRIDYVERLFAARPLDRNNNNNNINNYNNVHMNRRPHARGNQGDLCLSLLHFKKLESLDLTSIALDERSCKTLPFLKNLVEIRLKDCPSATDTFLYTLAKMPLVSIMFRACALISDRGMAALSKGPASKTLRHLELSGCRKNITAVGMGTLRMLPLRSLDISDCECVDDGAVRAAMPLPHLEIFKCSNTPVTDETCRLLALHCRQLHHINMSYSIGITDGGMEAVGALKNLRFVDVHHTRVTQQGFEVLKHKRGVECRVVLPYPWN